MKEGDLYENTETIIVDKSKPKYKTSAKSVKGLITGLIAKFRNDAKKGITYTPQELEMVFSEILRKIGKEISIESHNEKSEVKIKSDLGNYEIIRTRRGKEFSKTILKEEVDMVMSAIEKTGLKDKIPTRKIAEKYCVLIDLTINNHNRLLFENGEFVWDNFFSDRHLHTFLTDCLDVLDYYGIIEYKGGYSTLMKKNKDIC